MSNRLSGTLNTYAYTAQVLNLIGIPCGHEWVYSPQNVRRYPEIELLGDASPLAAPARRESTVGTEVMNLSEIGCGPHPGPSWVCIVHAP
jgi:hypothetical protein